MTCCPPIALQSSLPATIQNRQGKINSPVPSNGWPANHSSKALAITSSLVTSINAGSNADLLMPIAWPSLDAVIIGGLPGVVSVVIPRRCNLFSSRSIERVDLNTSQSQISQAAVFGLTS